jgi:hypothetical protein
MSSLGRTYTGPCSVRLVVLVADEQGNTLLGRRRQRRGYRQEHQRDRRQSLSAAYRKASHANPLPT